ncbi:hypothetical protein SAMD00019534_023100 [Acytostelium subglobosum LB1]|uniref:hypothetical protein n=1 Tax=Acytostelium subglobosum LB1 TaxID=1410327 RepID=UPI0006450490|nr:hypothetical protein SAMD00019534_023100 [Acytostelium subglobosum LB1]GAM19135.1 hypothetical protein SAMD00019534_023100 [Acytostelium subglobosum LB1]|eukprot:XP_012757062.1 hypothetical protein SAMD00019534_023100 [Acytostelium subglobosum LB1]
MGYKWDLDKKIEFLGGSKVSTWAINCSLYHERLPEGSTSTPREFHLITFSEKTKKSYIVSLTTVVEADRDILAIIEKTNSYKKKQTHEITGAKYELGDFVIRLGPVQLRADVKAIVMEVEYAPCLMTSSLGFNCTKLLQEFIVGYLGFAPEQVQTTYDFSAYQQSLHPIHYSDMHTAIQYVNLCKSLAR